MKKKGKKSSKGIYKIASLEMLNGLKCNKNSYLIKEEALQVASAQEEKIKNLKLYVYKCRRCKGYHLTKKKNKRNLENG